MRFKDVALKNFRAHMKKYIISFICSSFSIMILFMYSTLLFNDSIITKGSEGNGLDILMYISMFSIVVFSIFFTNYASSASLKARYKEFGVMMTVGMNKKDIIKLIITENLVIILSSLLIGIGTGAIFSRLFQMVVLELLGLKDIDFSLDYKSFLLTIGVFLIIFLVELIVTIITTRNFTIEELVKRERLNDGRLEQKLFPGIVGILITVIGALAIFYIGENKELRSNLTLSIGAIITMFIGIYIVISSLGMSILALIKKIPRLYNKNIIEVTNLNRKFKSQKKVIFILTMLATLTIFSIAPPLSLLNETETVVDLNLSDLEIASIFGLNRMDKEKIKEIAKKYKVTMEEETGYEFIVLDYKAEGVVDNTSKKVVISEEEYNLNSSTKLTVNKGEGIRLITIWVPDDEGIEVGDEITFNYGDKKDSFTIKNSLSDRWISNDKVLPTKSVIVLNNDDYKKIRENVNKDSIGRCYKYQIEDWMGKEDFVNEIKKSLVSKVTPGGEEYAKASDKYLFSSKPLLYYEMKQGYRFFVFITTIMGILFFLASASVLFFNQYIEYEENKRNFNKLYKIGLLKGEVKRIISKELIVTFFTPVIIGGFAAIVLMNFTAKVLGGVNMIDQFMSSAYKVVFIYFIFQVIFYFFARGSYIDKMKEIIK